MGIFALLLSTPGGRIGVMHRCYIGILLPLPQLRHNIHMCTHMWLDKKKRAAWGCCAGCYIDMSDWTLPQHPEKGPKLAKSFLELMLQAFDPALYAANT